MAMAMTMTMMTVMMMFTFMRSSIGRDKNEGCGISVGQVVFGVGLSRRRIV